MTTLSFVFLSNRNAFSSGNALRLLLVQKKPPIKRRLENLSVPQALITSANRDVASLYELLLARASTR